MTAMTSTKTKPAKAPEKIKPAAGGKEKSRPANKPAAKAGSEGAARTERLRKQALAEIRARLAGAEDPAPGSPTLAHDAAGGADADSLPPATPDAAGANVAPPAGRARGRKGAKAAKAAGDAPKKDAKPKRLSALDAAAKVLADADTPLRAADMIEAMAKRGLWTSPGGKTPEATLYAAIIREIAAKGNAARFAKHARGLFTARANTVKEA